MDKNLVICYVSVLNSLFYNQFCLLFSNIFHRENLYILLRQFHNMKNTVCNDVTFFLYHYKVHLFQFDSIVKFKIFEYRLK